MFLFWPYYNYLPTIECYVAFLIRYDITLTKTQSNTMLPLVYIVSVIFIIFSVFFKLSQSLNSNNILWNESESKKNVRFSKRRHILIWPSFNFFFRNRFFKKMQKEECILILLFRDRLVYQLLEVFLFYLDNFESKVKLISSDN